MKVSKWTDEVIIILFLSFNNIILLNLPYFTRFCFQFIQFCICNKKSIETRYVHYDQQQSRYKVAISKIFLQKLRQQAVFGEFQKKAQRYVNEVYSCSFQAKILSKHSLIVKNEINQIKYKISSFLGVFRRVQNKRTILIKEKRLKLNKNQKQKNNVIPKKQHYFNIKFVGLNKNNILDRHIVKTKNIYDYDYDYNCNQYIYVNVNENYFLLIFNMKSDQPNPKPSQIFSLIQKDFKDSHPQVKQQQDVKANLFTKDNLQYTQKKKSNGRNQQTSDHINTPKKEVKNPQQFHNQDKEKFGRIKAYYVSEKTNNPSQLIMVPLIIFIFLCLFVVFGSIYIKYEVITRDAGIQKSTCIENYQKNECQKPRPDLIQFCRKQKICMEKDTDGLKKQKFKLSYIFGQIIYEITQGAGAMVTLLGIFLIIAGLILGQQQTTIHTYTEYY